MITRPFQEGPKPRKHDLRSLAGGIGEAELVEELVCTVLPESPLGPDARKVAERTAGYLRKAPAAVRTVTLAGVASLRALSLAMYGKVPSKLNLPEKERLLGRLESHPTTAQALQGIKALVLLAFGAERYAQEILETAKQSRLSRPDPELATIESSEVPPLIKADVAVVGSGAGGAVAALRLAEAGASVVVLEEGRRFSVSEFRTGHPLDRFASLYRDAGTSVALGSPPIALPVGIGVGGTTLVNSGTCYRTPPEVLSKWAAVHRLEIADPDALAPHFTWVEELLGVAPVPLEIMGNNGRYVIEAAKSLGMETGPLQRNAPGCQGTCQCAIGCPTNSKAGVHLSVLPKACDLGARIVTRARAERILVEDGRAIGVLARRPGGSYFVVASPRVVVAAGALYTPPLLRRSGLARHRSIGRNLTIHPAFAVIGFVDHKVMPWKGVLQSAGVESFHRSHGILMEATSAPPGMSSAMLPGWGTELLDQFERMESSITLGAMIADRPSGRVLGRSKPTVFYQLDPADAERMRLAMLEVARVLDAAGTKEFVLPIAGSKPAGSFEEVRHAIETADTRRLHLAAFHPVGTAAAGGIPERHPVDEKGRLRGIEGVWIVDASVLPTCPEVNPQVTIMALSSAIASGIE